MLIGLLLGLLFVTPFVGAYVLIIRWVDRFEPEPWWLILASFAWGALFATLFGGLSSGLAESAIAQVAGLKSHDPRLDAFGATVLAPLFEEGFKAVGLVLLAGLGLVGVREIDGPLDGAIYGGVIGLGFTLTEDILYVAHQFAEQGLGGFVVLLFLRTVLLGLSHCTFTACTGLGFGMAAESRSWFVKITMPLVGLIVAMAMHAVHNGLPTFLREGGLVVMLVLSWLIDLLFFALLAVLVVRDRAIVMRELAQEVGGLLHPHELVAVTSYVSIGWRNYGVLLSKGWSQFQQRRRKQLSLVELAFIKSRRRRGETGRDLDTQEARLRHQIALANHRGIWIGS